MNDATLLDQVNRAREDFGTKCSKYAGAITVEFVRLALREHGISASPRHFSPLDNFALEGS